GLARDRAGSRQAVAPADEDLDLRRAGVPGDDDRQVLGPAAEVERVGRALDGDGAAGRDADVGVGAAAAVHLVVAAAAVEHVAAALAEQLVGAVAAHELVGAGAAAEDVGADAAVDQVG